MHFVRPLVCSCLALLTCLPAAAQTQQPTRPERPYRGVYAGGVGEGGQSLTATTSVSGGYDDNILADATQQNSPFRQGQQGKLAQFSGSINYSLSGARGELTAGAGSSLRYYPTLEDEYFDTYNASIEGQWVALLKPQLTLHQSVGYQPFSFLSDLAPGPRIDPLNPDLLALVAPDPDFVPISSQYVYYQGGADINARLTSRTSFVTSYSYRMSDRASYNFLTQTGTAGFTFGLTRDLSLRTMYRYTEARYPNDTVQTHTPDVGLDFNRALSLTRRTSLTFGAGTEATVVRGRTRYHLTGNANVSHEIGRSWYANGSYQRGTSFIDTLAEPVFGDTGSVGISGLLSRRIQFDARAMATLGTAGFDQQSDFNSYRGTVTLSTALNRYMNIGMDYAYYRYQFDQGIELEDGLPRHVNRQSIRAHISFWAPLMNRTRRGDATR